MWAQLGAAKGELPAQALPSPQPRPVFVRVAPHWNKETGQVERRALGEHKRPKLLCAHLPQWAFVQQQHCSGLLWCYAKLSLGKPRRGCYSCGFSFSGCLKAGAPRGLLPPGGAILNLPSWRSPAGLGERELEVIIFLECHSRGRNQDLKEKKVNL